MDCVAIYKIGTISVSHFRMYREAEKQAIVWGVTPSNLRGIGGGGLLFPVDSYG